MNSAIAVDTNILIYLHDDFATSKNLIAQEILAEYPQISAQIVSEYLNVSRRLINISKENLLVATAKIFSGCSIIPINIKILLLASELCIKYKFQLFDSIIVASALSSGCKALYSEDVHHGLVVNGSLKIVNPFI